MRLLPRSSCGPEACALFAALLNGTIGVLTRVGFDQGATPALIAFWKCFGAFLLVCTLCACRPQLRTQTVRLTRRWPQFACLSLLGIFGLYYFETKAFAQASIPLVSFLTYAAGGATIALSGLFLGEKVTRQKLLAFAAIVAGVGLMSLFEHGIAGSLSGIVLALMGGCGYALFIFLSKGFRIGSGLPQLVWLFGFGSLFLLMPLVSEGFAFPAGAMWATLCALVLLPTIGGFYFTTCEFMRNLAQVCAQFGTAPAGVTDKKTTLQLSNAPLQRRLPPKNLRYMSTPMQNTLRLCCQQRDEMTH
ncbi:DMT family transporter [Pandoraea apista]|uniref:DMT family transporter n=1 Tax=Pandoraea apista TaxID=93218 RepID=UPI000F67E2C9|nr:DMT family transporter [Pandoraea apista]RRW96603.1 DMT family transporter [Pandoraea apista]RRW97302.1 DMT family transporter [Pandoraea apista]